MNQCTWRSDLWSTLSDNHHLPISFISLAFLVFEFLVMVMSFAISDKTRRWVSNLNLSWQGMIDKQFLLTYYQYKERCFLSCHERGTKKKIWVPMRNRTSDLPTLCFDALPLSHRDSTVSKVYYGVHIINMLASRQGMMIQKNSINGINPLSLKWVDVWSLQEPLLSSQPLFRMLFPWLVDLLNLAMSPYFRL